MNCYFAPYEGDRDFLYFSFSTRDAAQAFPIIERLNLEGCRVWYDNGLSTGDSWRELIAAHLERAAAVVALISAASVDSHACRNEINYAAGSGKSLLSVFIEDTALTLGMARQLAAGQRLSLYESMDEEAFYTELVKAPALERCREENGGAGEAELEEWRLRAEKYRRAGAGKAAGGSEDDPLLQWLRECGGRPEEKETERKKEQAEKERQDRVRAEEDARHRAKDPAAYGAGDDTDTDPGDTTIRDPSDGGDTPRPELPAPAILYRENTGEVFSLERKQTVIGRKQELADVVLEGNRQISRRHAEILQRNGKLYIRDLGSSCGTTADGVSVGGEEQELRDIARISLGGEGFLVISGPIFGKLAGEREIGLLRSVRTGETRLLTGRRFPLDRSHPWAGDVLGSRRISRSSQTEIVRTKAGFEVEDLRSPNGTFLNGRRVVGRAERLQDGDEISVAEEKFVFTRIILADDDVTMRGGDYTLRDREYTLR